MAIFSQILLERKFYDVSVQTTSNILVLQCIQTDKSTSKLRFTLIKNGKDLL